MINPNILNKLIKKLNIPNRLIINPNILNKLIIKLNIHNKLITCIKQNLY